MARYRFSLDNVDTWQDHESDSDAEEAAEEWVKDGDWGEGKIFVSCSIFREDEEGEVYASAVEVEVGEDPPEPDCADGADHDWQSPYEIVGGLRENPGVWSVGGTQVASKEVCSCCGAIRNTTSESTPGQYPRVPEQVEYEEATEETLAWVQSLCTYSFHVADENGGTWKEDGTFDSDDAAEEAAIEWARGQTEGDGQVSVSILRVHESAPDKEWRVDIQQ